MKKRKERGIIKLIKIEGDVMELEDLFKQIGTVVAPTATFRDRFDEVCSYFEFFAEQNGGEVVYADMKPNADGAHIVVDVEDVCVSGTQMAGFRTIVPLLSMFKAVSTPEEEVLRIFIGVKP